MDSIQRTKGRFKAFDSDDDAGQWKTMGRFKADKVSPLPGKLTASWEPIGGSFYGMRGWVAIFGLCISETICRIYLKQKHYWPGLSFYRKQASVTIFRPLHMRKYL